MNCRERTHGLVQGALEKGHLTARDALVHVNGWLISCTNRWEPANPQGSAENSVYRMCFERSAAGI